MSYRRNNFEQYFADQSKRPPAVPEICVNYKKVEFKHKNHVHDGYYCVMYNEIRDTHQIYFKETSSKIQWVSNFNFPSKYYDSFQFDGKDIQLKTARGWAQMYNAMKWYIRNELKDLLEKYGEKEVEIIGWSLGSAIAQLCCQDLFFNFSIKSHVFTYGSVKPWYGKNKAMREYLKQCYVECYNFYDHNDIVGYMVPFIGYFALNHVKLKQDKFCLARLFNPHKYHTEYYKSEYYIDIK